MLKMIRDAHIDEQDKKQYATGHIMPGAGIKIQ